MSPPSPAVLASPEAPPVIDSRALRNCLGRFATGIAVVTTVDPDGHPVGLTVNSFAAVSLEPPLVLWSLINGSQYRESFRRASHFAVNVLAAEQEDISNRFATWPVDRFAGLAWRPGLGGAPLLDGCCAWFEVRNQVQHKGGDHTIFVGEIERFADVADVPPLLFHGGRYRRLAEDQQ